MMGIIERDVRCMKHIYCQHSSKLLTVASCREDWSIMVHVSRFYQWWDGVSSPFWPGL